MGKLISDKFAAWQEECEQRFQQLKANEEELNRIFIDIYGLQDELTPEVEDKDVTVRRADLTRESRACFPMQWGACSGGIRWMWMGWCMPAANGMTANM